MSNQGVKLLGNKNSQFTCRIMIALQIKGVKYEYQAEDIQNKSAELLLYNPVHRKIPVLIHNGKAIVESQVILEYIDETWKDSPILPKDPYDRAMARFWAKFIDDKCLPSTYKAYLGDSEEQKSSVKEAVQNLKLLDKELDNKKFFGGENIGFVDIVALFAYWLIITEDVSTNKVLSKENCPNICRWKDECVNCNVIKENLPDREVLAGLIRMRLGNAQ